MIQDTPPGGEGVLVESHVTCGACGVEVSKLGPMVIRVRQNGLRFWTVVHECGGGPPETIGLGRCPRPGSQKEAFAYHWHHGRLMRYRRWSVLRFAWVNRRNFEWTPFD